MASSSAEDLPILRPKPRRPFEITSDSPSSPDSTTPDASFAGKLDISNAPISGTTTPARTKSILNLTSSTLFGIFQPAEYGTDREDSTPWGSVPQTPADQRHGSFDFKWRRPSEAVDSTVKAQSKRIDAAAQKKPRKQSTREWLVSFLVKEIVLLGTGVLYGLLVSHLHDKQQIAPVKIDINRSSWVYLALWGIAGAVFGEALPWVDNLWTVPNDTTVEDTQGKDEYRRRKRLTGWNEVVRSVGAFVGISFAIRKLSWQSTLQLSLTLALANPALWYLIDRSAPGFFFSSAVSIAGTTILLLSRPDLIPAPPNHPASGQLAINSTIASTAQDELVFGVFTQESVGIWTWIASVLFVSTVCFGNIGRQLTSRQS